MPDVALVHDGAADKLSINVWGQDGALRRHSVDHAYWVNDATHGDIDSMRERSEYDDSASVLFINAGAVLAVEVNVTS